MNRRSLLRNGIVLAAAGLLLPLARPTAQAAEPDKDGFVSLFDGKTLNGWEGLDGFWSVKDGAIVGAETKEHAAPQTFLILKDHPVTNFVLSYKYKFATPAGNSGVQVRSKIIKPEQFQVGGYQADCDGDRHYDGSIYDEQGVAGGRATMSNRGEKTHWDADNKRHNTKMDQDNKALGAKIKANDWNDVLLVANGNHITYSINGEVMTDLVDDSPKALKTGVLALQLHHGFVMEIQFKDIKIKEMK